jgi:hypothetical protein
MSLKLYLTNFVNTERERYKRVRVVHSYLRMTMKRLRPSILSP